MEWENRPGVSDALFSQIDLMSSFASLTGETLSPEEGPDSFNHIDALLGKTGKGREWLVEHSGRLSVIKDDWKYIEPGSGPKIQVNTNSETGNDPDPQLYNINIDIGEKHNVAEHNPELVKELTELLKKIKDEGKSRF